MTNYLKQLEDELELKERKELLESIKQNGSIACDLYNSMQKYCDVIFDKWVSLLKKPTELDCVDKSIFCQRIFYQDAIRYVTHEDLTFPGIYLWAVGKDTDILPRYIGKSETSLKKRLFGRYLAKKGDSFHVNPPQCKLSEELRGLQDCNKEELLSILGNLRAIENKTNELESKKSIKTKKDIKIDVENRLFKSRTPKIEIQSAERLCGALDFARFNEDEIWFAVIPFGNESRKMIDIYETLFIRSAQQYIKNLPDNSKYKGYAHHNLLNKGKI